MDKYALSAVPRDDSNSSQPYAHLQTALQQISSWMSANLLTLNSSKTEFLTIGLKQQNRQLSAQYHSFCMQLWFLPRDAL